MLVLLLGGMLLPVKGHSQLIPAPGGTGFWYRNLFLMAPNLKVTKISPQVTDYECFVRNNLAHMLRLRVRSDADYQIEAYFLNIHTGEKIPMYAPELPAPPHLVDLTMFVGEAETSRRPYVVVPDKYGPVLMVFPSRYMVRAGSEDSWRFMVRVTKK
jgi:hypothetical protein